MLDREVLGKNAGEYEMERNRKKLGIFPMIVVFIKSTIGLAIFGYHTVFQKSGVWTGLIISALYIGLVIHGCARVVVFAEEIEESHEHLENYNTSTYFGKNWLIQKWLK